MNQRPDIDTILSGLKPFQRATVDHTFSRLWTDPDAVDRFLVADEVGLGKTMIAKGVAARAIDLLWSQRAGTDQPITIVYICSNRQIAQQNLSRLAQLTGGEVQDSADRLTMLPLMMNTSASRPVQVIAFTPGTSLNFGTSAGTVHERVLLQRLLSQAFPTVDFTRHSWATYLTGRAAVETFQEILTWPRFQHEISPEIVTAFRQHLVQPPRGGTPWLTDFFAHQAQWARTDLPSETLSRERYAFIAHLRNAMASTSVGLLEPDLIILDEFQRFKDLFEHRALDESSQAQQLAQQLITTGNAKTLVLSATPYKMYTQPDEPEGDDHYRDFTNTIAFLAGDAQAAKITTNLSQMRKSMLTKTPESRAAAIQSRTAVEYALTKVMSRTERIAATRDGEGMLETQTMDNLRLEAPDVLGWRGLDEIGQSLGVGGAFEYWRSAPYTLNLMDKEYQFQDRFQAALQHQDPTVQQQIKSHQQSFLPWSAIQAYREINPANPKLRALTADLVGSGAWRLAWISPSLPYIEPGGVFSSRSAQQFTKRLIFSAWNIVPKTVASLLSYEVERRAVTHAAPDAKNIRNYDGRAVSSPLPFGWDMARNMPRNLPNLTLLYPSPTLARLGDPLTVAAELGTKLPLDPTTYLHHLEHKISRLLNAARIHPTQDAGGLRRRWYGVAPWLLDQEIADAEGWTPHLPIEAWSEGDVETRLADHVRWAKTPLFDELGDPPEDLAQVLALMAAAAPGVTALRSITRGAPADSIYDLEVRQAALTAAHGFRNLFSRPTITALVRGAFEDSTHDTDSYWHQTLQYCFDGNLQSVLDEYVHMLTGSAVRDASVAHGAKQLADHIHDATSIRTAQNSMYDFQVGKDETTAHTHHINSHIAARFGRSQSSDGAAQREATVRESFNSPFWPFVLASTSVGQEGLDFHTYSHAVVHWNLPSNPVDLEQREGRVHRYKGHAVRKNVAADYGHCAIDGSSNDPWQRMFNAAQEDRPPNDALLDPYWVKHGEAKIQRFVPAMPLSKETCRYASLVATLGKYRFVLGQPRQHELIQDLGPDVEQLHIDLSPPTANKQPRSEPTD